MCVRVRVCVCVCVCVCVVVVCLFVLLLRNKWSHFKVTKVSPRSFVIYLPSFLRRHSQSYSFFKIYFICLKDSASQRGKDRHTYRSFAPAVVTAEKKLYFVLGVGCEMGEGGRVKEI